MGTTGRRTAAMLAVLAAFGPAHAQGQPEAASDGVTLDAVEVTARRALEERFFAPGSLVIVDRRDIERLGAFSVADVLKQLPGVVVNTAADGSVEIRMRGMERSATQLLVDGQRSGGGRNQLPLDQLPPEMIERIEVVRSPSAEFSGATGGTINIVLRQATVKREASLRLTDIVGRGRHAGNLFASRSGPVGGTPASTGADAVPESPWAYFVAASLSGWLLGTDAHGTTTSPAGTTRTEASSRYRRHEPTLVTRLNGRLGPADQLALRATLTRSTLGGFLDTTNTTTGPAGTATSATHEPQHQDRSFAQAGADWTHRFAASKAETTLVGSQLREDVDRLATVVVPAGGGAFPFMDRRTEDAWTVKTKLSATDSQLLWMGGAELERRDLAVDTATGADAFGANAVLERRVLWGQNEWALGQGTFTAGVRGESVRIGTQARGLAPSTRHIPILQPSAHVRMPIDADTQWRANVARTTRNPRVWDLVDRTQPSSGTNSLVNPDTAGNPGLRPERAWALDAGLERKLSQEGHAGGNLFVRRVQDAIGPLVTQVGSRWVEQRANAGDATVWGVEVDARVGVTWLGLSRDWTLTTNASLLQSRMTSGPNTGERIPGQPCYTASLNLAKPMRRTGGLYGGVTVNLTGAADLNTSPGRTGRDRARALVDTHIGGVVPRLGYWRVGLQNIGDARFARDRRVVDPAGNVTTSSGSLTFSPRGYVAIGTQF